MAMSSGGEVTWNGRQVTQVGGKVIDAGSDRWIGPGVVTTPSVTRFATVVMLTADCDAHVRELHAPPIHADQPSAGIS